MQRVVESTEWTREGYDWGRSSNRGKHIISGRCVRRCGKIRGLPEWQTTMRKLNLTYQAAERIVKVECYSSDLNDTLTESLKDSRVRGGQKVGSEITPRDEFSDL
ncbi:hypothetical protein TNCV_3938001 [Trichonephila clavipes]|nr:hypothetical protein TNCV_3938001 [Trichonephila clavipes]